MNEDCPNDKRNTTPEAAQGDQVYTHVKAILTRLKSLSRNRGREEITRITQVWCVIDEPGPEE